MPVDFGSAERHILGLFSPGSEFRFEGVRYSVSFAAKPTCSRGEPKTDVFVRAGSDGCSRDFKISFKKSNANFLENKINPERAKQLLGSDWQKIISKATLALKEKFCSRPLVFKQRFRRTKVGAITLGWKFELLNVKLGELSGDMLLSRDQVVDVYAGTNLEGDKRDASVNGTVIPGSGIANFILFEEKRPATAQEAVDRMVSIDDYVNDHPNIYFACKALNYRTKEKKYDGNRPLAVYVDWSAQDGKLVSRLVFDTPLQQGGKYAYGKLRQAMKELGVTSTASLGDHNVKDMSIVWDG